MADAHPGERPRAPSDTPSTVDKIRDNPFYVLGLGPSAGRAEIEREGQKLIGMLELDLKSAKTYATPVGPCERTTDKVRRAMAELRDPERRLEHELWARLDPRASERAAEAEGQAPEKVRGRADAPWPGALTKLGWRASR